LRLIAWVLPLPCVALRVVYVEGREVDIIWTMHKLDILDDILDGTHSSAHLHVLGKDWRNMAQYGTIDHLYRC